MTEFN